MKQTGSAVAIITGAAQGIGRQAARVLSGRGYALVLNDLREPAETLAGLGGSPAASVLGDVSLEETVEWVVAVALERFGRVDVLMNNAGVSLITPALFISTSTRP
ncbi:MAG TPA: SDR family NAD(P)-dependent oxidoreductase, partial [Deinococcales bacterium]|nr:SDR family NAD(P)-dependent oxidoreductase [Deinococcales bacterium]